MTQHSIDRMDDASQWNALAPDGTASTEISLSSVASPTRLADEATSLEVVLSADALDHRIERSIDEIDLTELDEIRFGVRSNRPADGSQSPFHLRLELAGPTMDFDDPANTWHRFVPIAGSEAWSFVRLGLEDVPSEIRGALNRLRVTCVDSTEGFTVYFSEWIAARDEMIFDVESALLLRLHQVLTLAGTPVEALFYHSSENVVPTPPAPPAIRLRLTNILASSSRSYPAERRDFTSSGFSISPAVTPYDLIYEVEIFAATAADRARMLDFVLSELAPTASLTASGRALPVRRLLGAMDDELSPLAVEPPLKFRIGSQQEQGLATLAPRLPEQITVEVEQP